MTSTVTIKPDDLEGSLYGPVEIGWHDDRLTITAVGAWRASVCETVRGPHGQQVVIEFRPPDPEEFADVPDAD